MWCRWRWFPSGDTEKGVTRQMVEERLKEVFMDSLVGVADCNLVWE